MLREYDYVESETAKEMQQLELPEIISTTFPRKVHQWREDALILFEGHQQKQRQRPKK